MIKAIIFDCFGVLYPDTFWTMADEYLGDALPEYRQELHNIVQQVDLGHITRDELWSRFADIVGRTVDEVYARLKEFSGLDVRLLNFVEEHKGDYKFGMISNVGRGFIERMFVEKPAEYYFEAIILSSDVGLVKPDKKIYELAAKKLDCELEECVFLDDLEKNARGADEAGMHGIQYRSYSQAMKELRALLNMADADE